MAAWPRDYRCTSCAGGPPAAPLGADDKQLFIRQEHPPSCSGRPRVSVFLPEPVDHYKPGTGELSVPGSQAPRGHPERRLSCHASPSGGVVGTESACSRGQR